MKTHANYNSETAALYASLGIEGTTYQVPFHFIAAEVGSLAGCRVLEFGCGAGRSTKFLKSLSPNRLIGVDHNAAMIKQAREYNYMDIEFRSIPENGAELPFSPGSFDAVFAFFVYLEFADSKSMRQTTAEIYRLLKAKGSFYVSTINPTCLGADFISFHWDKKENVKDGDPITCHVHTEPPFTISDIWWSIELLDDVFQSCGFSITKKSLPLATGSNWRDETRIAPQVIYRLSKL